MEGAQTSLHRWTWPIAQVIALLPAVAVVAYLDPDLDQGLRWMEAFGVIGYYTVLLMMTSLSLYMSGDSRPHPEAGYLFLLPAGTAAWAWWQFTTGAAEWTAGDSSWSTTEYLALGLTIALTLGAWGVHFRLYSEHYLTLVGAWSNVDPTNQRNRRADKSGGRFRRGDKAITIREDDE